MSERPVPTSGALADVRVLDISAVLAGPGIARHLADFGADVIKVERAGVGDTARNLGWRDPEDGETYFFKLTNRNKRFIELDLSDADGRDQLLILVAEAHVLVENMRP
ncbi:MAG: CoA transferase, partial [Actinomycetia bacterium]|nr:CoA transferase [Actinomycetes bacterium]